MLVKRQFNMQNNNPTKKTILIFVIGMRRIKRPNLPEFEARAFPILAESTGYYYVLNCFCVLQYKTWAYFICDLYKTHWYLSQITQELYSTGKSN